ncbi:adenylosuccinate synthase [Acetobacter nitrogenifigens DSM 23921 = NBRC 105050]|uniref:Adenylosuccinate synthetase n=1 Tax=Acetobacter nitrogenifigens DSM 23921 = NBRC 105050 TaxID=1120919 RepID=A0A511X8T0_9PROT|nr:adenylosuccinate synthetase [Acetobacter nitrogenifigens]GBQ87506.1 adenylosuccinate synthase [Acetobacter nitrogenifigens DSM 23921 = NBRC 105050]GEN59331.1 hypothetical protein ANI02nite_12150 [Acetobacter nitrogenifigens DSM 23921 = NBRC 105050]
MTHAAQAVIGAAYGDEGKGRVVDWLATLAPGAVIVVRSNGGAQAGHTVTLADGTRHVFHHIGSGALAGASTHLSQFMVSHPMLFREERDQVAAKSGCVHVTADPRGAVTTPWDMMINQALESSRGEGRHGSCGMGFGETVGRTEDTEHTLTVADLRAPQLRDKLRAIQGDWLPARMQQLGLEFGNDSPLSHAASSGIIERFVDDCLFFSSAVDLREDATLGADQTVIFEAAQGLRLDQNYPDFPYLTRSNTGVANIAAIAREASLETIEAFYVTRCYLTRHGRGPMSDERNIAPFFAVDDPTNQPNPWQETQRFGLLDPAALASDIHADMACASGVALRPAIAVTCLDQCVGARVTWIRDGKIVDGSRDEFLADIRAATHLTQLQTFAGPMNR